MDVYLIGWLALLLASIVTLFITIQIWQGKTTDFVHRGFFESVGGDQILRKERPIKYWFMIAVRCMGAVGLWLLWYASWFVR